MLGIDERVLTAMQVYGTLAGVVLAVFVIFGVNVFLNMITLKQDYHTR
ncbi:Uncharacterised protein [Weissella viridescens]|uniref:Uncharacterized protein n=1 Tax=Weissella viridescens TaxID=1629 RepID=A0A380NXG1_WEIVI|nr:Uncharacterised protein [Weissella viridescens]